MAKINFVSVPKYKPRVRDYGQNVRLSRAQRALESAPEAFTLELRLVLEKIDGSLVNSSSRTSRFVYSIEKMRWENESSCVWDCTIPCTIVALDLVHPALGTTLLRQLIDITAGPGMTITFQQWEVHFAIDAMSGDFHIPNEDYVIEEVPDAIDWQKQLEKALKSPTVKKKRFIRR